MKKAIHVCLLYLPLLLTAFLLSACQKKSYAEYDFFAMDTYVSVKANGTSDKELKSVQTLLESLEKTYSRTDPASEIYRINASEETTVSASCAALLDRAFQAAATTDGAFQPCLGALTELWDITGAKHLPTDDEIAAVLPYTACDMFEISGTTVTKKDARAKLDLGAAVKGYAAEEALRQLQAGGVADAMISLGGNIAVCGNAENRNDGWVIGVRSPYFPETLALTFSCTDRVIAVSGDYERYFEKDGVRYHHIFDSSTGKPARSGLRSTVVIAEDGFVSDMLSTALFVMGAEKAAAFYESGVYDFEAILFADDGTVLATDGILESLHLLPDAKTENGTPLALAPLTKNEKTHIFD